MGTEYVDRGLTPNTNYLYRTQECDDDVCSDWTLTPASTESSSSATEFVIDMTSYLSASLPISGAQAGTIIDWGDGNVQTLTASATEVSHNYAAAGVYTVTIMGPHTGIWNYSHTTTHERLVEVRKISSSITSLSGLYWCSGIPNGTGCRLMSSNAMSYLENWDTSNIIDMSHMFDSAFPSSGSAKILNLENWDTSKVKNMKSMFDCAFCYNQNPGKIEGIGNWDTSAVTNMAKMFTNIYYGVSSSPPALPAMGKWDVSNVTDMTDMFYGAYNQTTIVAWPNLRCWAVPLISAKPSGFSAAPTWNISQQPSWGATVKPAGC